MLYSLGFNNSSLLPNVTLTVLRTGLSSKQGWGMLHLEQTPCNLVLRSFPWKMWAWTSLGSCLPFPCYWSDRGHCLSVCRASFLKGSPQVPKFQGNDLGWSSSSMRGEQRWKSALSSWGLWGLNLAGGRHFKHPPPFRVSADTLCPAAGEPKFLHEGVCQCHPEGAVPSLGQGDAQAWPHCKLPLCSFPDRLTPLGALSLRPTTSNSWSFATIYLAGMKWSGIQDVLFQVNLGHV